MFKTAVNVWVMGVLPLYTTLGIVVSFVLTTPYVWLLSTTFTPRMLYVATKFNSANVIPYSTSGETTWDAVKRISKFALTPFAKTVFVVPL